LTEGGKEGPRRTNVISTSTVHIVKNNQTVAVLCCADWR